MGTKGFEHQNSRGICQSCEGQAPSIVEGKSPAHLSCISNTVFPNDKAALEQLLAICGRQNSDVEMTSIESSKYGRDHLAAR